MTAYFTRLAARAVIAVSGPDRVSFLQGLITNDVTKVSEQYAIYAALLTAQGRFLHDLFLIGSGATLLLDAEADRLPDLMRRLTIYRLRAKVTMVPAPNIAVYATFGDDSLAPLGLTAELGNAAPFADGIAFVDPRRPGLGARVLASASAASALAALGLQETDVAAYDRMRLALGVPDGSRDMVPEKSLLMESGFGALNGIDWDKGCYVGQELTARMNYRALVKKGLVRVSVTGPMPAPGTVIMRGAEEVGEMRSGRDGMGLAMLRLDATGPVLRAGDATIAVRSE